MTRENDQSGFTLLEIMLAMLVLGLVVSMVSLALSSSINVIQATLNQGNIYYRAQVSLERISEDLISAVLPEEIEFIGGQGDGENGSANLLSFASMAHLVFQAKDGQAGMGILRYAVQADKEHEGQFILVRADELYRPGWSEDQETEAFLLCDRLRSVKFSFIGSNGEKLDSWDTTVTEEDEEQERRLPVAVSCLLEFWLDQDEETTQSFQTTVILPVGQIQAEPEDTDAS